MFRAASGKVSLVFEFGGQGFTYFSELKTIVEKNPSVVPLFERVAAELATLGAHEDVYRELGRGLDLIAWMKSPPPAEYLERAPMSFPLIGLTQMLMYYTTLKRTGVSPDESRKLCSGAIGHSSGISAAMVAAAATSFEHLEDLIVDSVRYLFWHGVRCQQETPIHIQDPSKSKDNIAPMLNVRGLPVKVVEKAVETYNKSLGDKPSKQKTISIGLVNGPDTCVVVGSDEAVPRFMAGLERNFPPADGSQSRVPFSSRKYAYTMEYLKVTTPFHSPLISAATAKIVKDAATSSPLFSALTGADLAFPVFSTENGVDIRETAGALLPLLIELQVERPLDWRLTTQSIGKSATIICDFGPSGKRGVSAISSRFLAGRAISFVHASPDGKNASLYPDAELLSDVNAEIEVPRSWEAKYSPTLACVGMNDEIVIDNQYSRLLGAPPLLVAGMTPWSHYQQVGATNQAGYASELAGGGIPLPHLFDKEIRDLAQIIPSGQGICANLLFLNPYLWGFQFPLIEKLVEKGEPIDSVTVAAGVPGPEKAAEIVDQCRRCGMRYMSFKPGSADAILQVLELAKAHPDFYMVIQFTGGRAGGHHSFEDQYEPLLKTYANIRAHKNAILVVGGGLGDADSCWEFLSGEWSLRFDQPKMPCDGVLFGTRVMACKEAATCDGAKDMIVAAKGVEEQKDWEMSYKDDAGGVITVLSELGEPIHVVNNRGARCWRQFDNKFFTQKGEGSTTAEQMVELLNAEKEWMIKMLNDDYQKPWFGKKMDGTACDLGDMTYKEVALRLTDLHWYAGDMPGMPKPKWYDVSFRERVFDWLKRTEERFCKSSKEAFIVAPKQLEENPNAFIEDFFKMYPEATKAVLMAADVDYFISSICGIPTRKPINFVPEISIMFKRYFKSDSLWYAEQIEAVPGYDADKSFIITGPVAAQYINKKDETVKEILDGINNGLIEHIKKASPGKEIPRQRELASLDDARQDATSSASRMKKLLESSRAIYKVQGFDNLAEITVGDAAPSFEDWMKLLTHTDHGQSLGGFESGTAVCADGVWSGARWLHSLLSVPRIQRGDRRAPSAIARILAPVPKGRVVIRASETDLLECSFLLPDREVESIHLRYFPNTDEIHMTCTYHAPDESKRGAFPLEIKFHYQPKFRGAPIHEILDGRNDRINDFYSRMWLGESTLEPEKAALAGAPPRVMSQSTIKQVTSQAELSLLVPSKSLDNSAFQETVKFSAEHVRKFCVEVGQIFPWYVSAHEKPGLPMDFAMVVCWKAMIRSIISDERIGSVDLLRLLHLENKFKQLQERRMKSDEDSFENTFSVTEIQNTASGKRVTTRGTVTHEGRPWVIVTSSFFIPFDVTSSAEMKASRGVETEVINKTYIVKIDSEAQRKLLTEKKWFEFKTAPSIGASLRVEIISQDMKHRSDGSLDCATMGAIFVNSVSIGKVSYSGQRVAKNALIAFLDRTADEYPPYKEMVGYEMLQTVDEVMAPTCMDRYSSVSGDINPIHTDPYFARLGGLDHPIVHGMWLSANARRVLATYVGQRDKILTDYFRCSFVEKVLPGETLRTSLRHTGMRNGKLVVNFQTVDSAGTVVCAGSADIGQPTCAFTFTGQGSVRVGMGMDLYETSETSKKTWDAADKHFLQKYGFSILEIVRENPKEKTIHFGGIQGNKRREFYMSMTRSSETSVVPMFPDIKPSSTSYTFKAPMGVLFSTQFTQPALILTEMVQYMDIMGELCFPKAFMFAGHSLGEYAALASVTGCFELGNLLDIIFLRGMTMQSVVPRDKNNRSDYAMIAVDPTRITKGFNAKALGDLIDAVDKEGGGLLQIVNYNVEPSQYVVAGDLNSQTALMHVCNTLNAAKEPPNMKEVITKSIEQAKTDRAASKGPFGLKRGKATIPLEGIDVPFHSRFLRSGVPHFRSIIQANMKKEDIHIERMEGMYIPNLVAKPFNLSKAFAEDVQSVASSPVLEKLLPTWDDYVKKDRPEAALVLIIELLAYQFASPVRWIETTDVLLLEARCRKFVELGPAPVLSNMLKTAMAKNPKFLSLHGSVDALSYDKDIKQIYFRLNNKGPSAQDVLKSILADSEKSAPAAAPAPVAAAAAPAPVAVAAPAAVAVAAHVVSAPSGCGGGAEVNAPPSALDTIRVILAGRFSKTPDAIDPTTTVKAMSGGKSAMQNEIVGDLGKEFADADSADLEDAADVSLAQLAKTVQASYKKLGKITTAMLTKMVTAKLPAGSSISKLKTTLSEEYMLGPLGLEGAMVSALAVEPSDRLGDGPAFAAYRSAVVKHYGDYAGQPVGSQGGGGGCGAGGPAVAVGAVDPKMAAKLTAMVTQLADVYRDYLEQDPLKDVKALEMEQSLRSQVDARMASVTEELGEDLMNGVQPFFNVNKVREYNAWWALAKMDVLILWDALKQGKKDEDRARNIKNRMTVECQKLLAWLAKRSEPKVAEIMQALAESPVKTVGTYVELTAPTEPYVEVDKDGSIVYKEVPRKDQPDMKAYINKMQVSSEDPKSRYLGIGGYGVQDNYCSDMTKKYFDALRDITSNGLSFQGKVALITGASPASISTPVVKALLAGGCTVICAFRGAKYDWFQEIYEESAGAHSRLIIVPFNCGSAKDTDSVLDYIYSTLNLDPDFCLPFAALSENGRGVADLDSKSELAHRIMLTNVLRLVGKIKNQKEQRRILGKVCVVVVPLSPNRGDFGFDGLYAESKLGLGSLFMKWSSEKIQDYIAIVGAEIGWTRGTGLMNANNQVSKGVEELGMRTFTSSEMCFNIMGLLHPVMVAMVQLRPLVAQLTGGMGALENLADKTAAIRADLALKSVISKTIFKDKNIDRAMEKYGSEQKAETAKQQKIVKPRSVPGRSFLFPKIPTAEKRDKLKLEGMADPASVVVITGFGEVGPYGNSTTRWEMEADGEFSIEGCIEMAWMMGLTKYFNGRLTGPDGKSMIYSGWVDAAKNEPLADWEVKARFEKQILDHTGLRILEPELFWGFDPRHGAKFYHSVLIDHDLEPVEVADEETAREFQKMHGDNCVAFVSDGVWFVKIKRGSTIYVPKSMRRDRWVCGQVPTGWNAKLYGIPDDIINQVDRVTLFTLVSFVESLVNSGVTDPYEFYKYVHVSKVGNCVGSGIGGMRSLREMFMERKLGDAPNVQGDVLQETFINTTAAWINMLLLSCSGPIKTPVGACATAMESFSIAVDTIQNGQAKMVVAGAFDDLNEESMLEFSNMKATANADEQTAKDRPPKEMSRPMTSTRSGFVESHGAGIALLMAGDLAIEMGVPIYGLVGLVHCAMDREGRSVPAPGKGVLTIAAEAPTARFSPALSLEYRRKHLDSELQGIEDWHRESMKALDSEMAGADATEAQQYKDAMLEEYNRQKAAAQKQWCQDWWKGHNSISPLRGALASWNLTIDDIGMASCHGTSTKLNDKNESDIMQTQMKALGRKEGNPLCVVTQKWLTGHPKGPASAWQVNGAVQAMLSGRVPGNRNLDNVDPELKVNQNLLYTSSTLNVGPMNAVVVTSFGFGQAGGELLLVHPDSFLATLSQEALNAYTLKRDARWKDSNKFHEEVVAGRRKYVEIKTDAPYPAAEVKDWMLGKHKRMGAPAVAADTAKSADGALKFTPPTRAPTSAGAHSPGAVADAMQKALVSATGEGTSSSSVGVDVESVSNPCFVNSTFIERNYTQQERSDCGSTTRSYAGLWAGKEAVVKALGNSGAQLKSAGSSLQEIELTRAPDGTVSVKLHGYAAAEANRVGIQNLKVSLSYADDLAVAAVVSPDK
jgi:fatty acid synthase subunit beta